MARHLRAKEAFDALLRDMQMIPEDLILYAPIFEIRYKTQDPGITYVETDLEELTREKALLVSEICLQPNLTSRGNFHLMAANALDRQQLQAAVKHFRRDRPIAVVNEGLLLYLSASEMQTVARNIRDLLEEFGGVWITPDFSLKEDLRNATEQQRLFRRIVAAATDTKLYGNAFDDNEQLLAFFDDLGLHSRILWILKADHRLG